MTAAEQAAHDAWASAGEERDERDERPEDERAEDEAAARGDPMPDPMTIILRSLAGTVSAWESLAAAYRKAPDARDTGLAEGYERAARCLRETLILAGVDMAAFEAMVGEVSPADEAVAA